MTPHQEEYMVARDQALERGGISACDRWSKDRIMWNQILTVSDDDGWIEGHGGGDGDGEGHGFGYGGGYGGGYGDGYGYGYGDGDVDGDGEGENPWNIGEHDG